MTHLFAGPRSTSFFTPVRSASLRSLLSLSNMPQLVGGSYLGPSPSTIRDDQEKSSDFDHKCRYNMTSHDTEYVYEYRAWGSLVKKTQGFYEIIRQ